MTCEEYVALFLAEHAKQTQALYEQVTPVDSGNARDNYVSEINTEGYVITNSVDYIVALDEGHSQQAPAGMTVQVCDSVQSITDSVIAKLPGN